MRQFVFWALLVFLVVRLTVIGVLGATGGIDPTFFTYQNFMIDTVWLLLLSQAIWSRRGFELWTLIVLPLYWGATVFVALAIVVIVYLNDGIFMKTALENGGRHTVGQIHAGDWILHQWPWAEALLVLVLLWGEFSAAFQNFFYRSSLNAGERTLYVLAFLAEPLLMLGFYMLNFDFLANYPTSVSHAGVIALVIVLGLLVQSGLLLAFCFLAPRAKDSNTLEKKES